MMSSDGVKKVNWTLENVVKLGRSAGITVLWSNHEINDSARSKVAHSSATHSVYFVSSHKHKVRKTLLQRYGMTPGLVDDILKRNDRWFCITHNTPQMFISPTLITTIDNYEDVLRQH